MKRLRHLIAVCLGGVLVAAIAGAVLEIDLRIVLFVVVALGVVLTVIVICWDDLRRRLRAERDNAVRDVTAMIDRSDDKTRQGRNKAIKRLERTSDWQLHQQQSLVALYRMIDERPYIPAMRQMAASPDFLHGIATRVHRLQPTHVVECGSGLSTLVLAYALRNNGAGRVTALEHLDEFASATASLIAEHGLEHWAEVRHAPLEDITIGADVWRWYENDAIPPGPFDLIVVDGPPSTIGPNARYPAGPLLFDKLAVDGVVVLDDLERPDEQDVAERWRDEFAFLEYRKLPLRRGGAEFRRTDRGEMPGRDLV